MYKASGTFRTVLGPGCAWTEIGRRDSCVTRDMWRSSLREDVGAMFAATGSQRKPRKES